MYARTYAQNRDIPLYVPQNYHGDYLREVGKTEKTPVGNPTKTEQGLLSDVGKILTGTQPNETDTDTDTVFLLVLALLLFSERKEDTDNFAWIFLFLLLLG